MTELEWILFDFGGCLDSDGIHSRTLFLRHFINKGLFPLHDPIELFQNAYTYADRLVCDESLVQNCKLMEMNVVMCTLIDRRLGHNSDMQKINELAASITDEQAFYLNRNKILLNNLSQKFQLGIVSNFSGNLGLILQEFSLEKNFNFILDSFHIKIAKPDLQIFKLALKKTNCQCRKVCFVGDNIERDITPAHETGMKTILLTQEKITSKADVTINSLMELQSSLNLL